MQLEQTWSPAVNGPKCREKSVSDSRAIDEHTIAGPKYLDEIHEVIENTNRLLRRKGSKRDSKKK